jgi:hypothetical protein
MSCIVRNCTRRAVDGSNYCDTHIGGGPEYLPLVHPGALRIARKTSVAKKPTRKVLGNVLMKQAAKKASTSQKRAASERLNAKKVKTAAPGAAKKVGKKAAKRAAKRGAK